MHSRDRVLTAYHEAGHTIVAAELGAENLRVSIKRTEEHLGIAWARTMQFQGMDRVRIALAGPTAEWFYSGRWGWKGAATDDAHVVEWHAQLRDRVGDIEAERELDYCADDAARTVADSWAAVDALAMALLDRKSLAHRQVIKILAAVEGKVLQAPRRWSRRPRDSKLLRLMLNADVYRQHAAARGIDKEVHLGLVLVPRVPPNLRVRMAAIDAELRALPKSRFGTAPVIPRRLQKKQDALLVALNKALTKTAAQPTTTRRPPIARSGTTAPPTPKRKRG